MDNTALTPSQARTASRKAFDRNRLIETLNKAIMARPDQIDTGIWISTDVIHADEEMLRSCLPGWDVRYQVDSRDGNCWVITAKK